MIEVDQLLLIILLVTLPMICFIFSYLGPVVALSWSDLGRIWFSWVNVTKHLHLDSEYQVCFCGPLFLSGEDSEHCPSSTAMIFKFFRSSINDPVVWRQG